MHVDRVTPDFVAFSARLVLPPAYSPSRADYYYYATAGGRRFWVRSGVRQGTSADAPRPQWKKYLTTMQIIQFVIDLFAVYFASTYLFLGRP